MKPMYSNSKISEPLEDSTISKIMEDNGEISKKYEKVEPTENEKRELLIKEIKDSHLRYKTKKHFGILYKKKRKRKNKQAKISRRKNRN